MKKMVGYILALAGLLVFVLSYPAVRSALKIPVPAGINDLYITIAGVILLLVGIFMAFKSGKKQPTEIPIYEGHGKERKLVGIQRIHEK